MCIQKAIYIYIYIYMYVYCVLPSGLYSHTLAKTASAFQEPWEAACRSLVWSRYPPNIDQQSSCIHKGHQCNSPRIEYGGEAPKDYTKLRRTMQSPKGLYKAPTDYTKPRQTTQSPRKTIQSPRNITQTYKY